MTSKDSISKPGAAAQGARVGATVGGALGSAVGEAALRAQDAAEALAGGYTAARERLEDSGAKDTLVHGYTAARERLEDSGAKDSLVSGYGTLRTRLADADAGALVRQWSDVLEGVVEDGRERASAVLSVVPTRRRRRWPWGVGAAVAGAAAGAGVAYVLTRVIGKDAPDAQEPDQLRAIVDPAPAGLRLEPDV